MSAEDGRVVVVDDSWVILEQIRQCLSARGYDVRTTTGVDVAVKLARNADLAIIDYHMPGMNGEELLQMLKAVPENVASCVFYLYTSDPEVAPRYDRLGFDGVLFRKGDIEALGTQVDAVFRTIRMRRLAQRMRQGRGSSV